MSECLLHRTGDIGIARFVHLLGFATTWRLRTVQWHLPPSLLPTLAAGSVAVRAMGLLWLLCTGGFVVSAAGLWAGLPWWRGLTAATVVLLWLLCIAWWHDAKFAAIVDIAILAGLALTTLVRSPVRAWPGS